MTLTFDDVATMSDIVTHTCIHVRSLSSPSIVNPFLSPLSSNPNHLPPTTTVITMTFPSSFIIPCITVKNNFDPHFLTLKFTISFSLPSILLLCFWLQYEFTVCTLRVSYKPLGTSRVLQKFLGILRVLQKHYEFHCWVLYTQ